MLIMMRQEFDLGPLRDMTWLQLDGGYLYGAHEVADDDDNDDDYYNNCEEVTLLIFTLSPHEPDPKSPRMLQN